jgi:hypothetical protein
VSNTLDADGTFPLLLHTWLILYFSCCNLLAVILWSLSTDKFGRRLIINGCQTFICVILFIVGGLYWTGATTNNAQAGTALVCFTCIKLFDFILLICSLAGYLLLLDLLVPDHRHVVLLVFCRTPLRSASRQVHYLHLDFLFTRVH